MDKTTKQGIVMNEAGEGIAAERRQFLRVARTSGFTVAAIPHTAEVTTLGAKVPGDTVNLEVDLIAKYTERLLAFGSRAARRGDR